MKFIFLRSIEAIIVQDVYPVRQCRSGTSCTEVIPGHNQKPMDYPQ